MKAAFIHDHRFLEYSGEVYSNQITYHFLKRYLDVFDQITVIGRRADTSENASTQGLERTSGPGINFHLVENISSLGSFFGARQRVKKQLSNIIDSCDIAIARLPSELGLTATYIARCLGKPFAVEIVGCPWDANWSKGGVAAKVYAPFMFFRSRSAIRRAEAATYVTKEFLQRRYPPGPSTIVSSVSDVAIPELEISTLNNRLRKSFGAGGIIRIGLIGSLNTNYKGIDVAIRSVSRLISNGQDVELRVLGPGNAERFGALSESMGLAGRIHFDGSLPSGSEVFHWLDGIDIYIQPSRQEGLPRALVEALSRACPAVGSTAGGIPELLDVPFLCKPGDHVELAHIINRLINSRETRELAVRNNFTAARSFESKRLDREVKKFTNTLANIAERKKTDSKSC